MMRVLKIMALILPVFIPILLAGHTAFVRSTADTYFVRIEGYDPRDMLYGHYLNFRFAPENSRDPSSFPPDIAEKLESLGHRYYIPEAQAYRLEELLQGREHKLEVEVGLPTFGKPFMGDLYIDEQPMAKFLNEFENRVDLDGDAERQ